MVQEHPFAPYIRIIGKGPRLSRPLTRAESFEAGKMILSGQVDPVQLGAFLCILRVRQEDPNEGAGFVDAIRATVQRPVSKPKVDLDWPSYAGKIRQLPYYLLAALALSQSGIRIFMHGTSGHTADRIYSREVLHRLNIQPAQSLEDAAHQLGHGYFSYLDLEHIHPKLQEIIDLKHTLGVRTPINTFSRMTNIFDADHVVQCITHGAYREIHRDCAALLGIKRMCVFKGEGGEAERRPAKPVTVDFLDQGAKFEEDWPSILEGAKSHHDTEMDLNRLPKIWQGDDTTPYAIQAIIGTIAIILRLLNKAETPQIAYDQATKIWAERRPTLGV